MTRPGAVRNCAQSSSSRRTFLAFKEMLAMSLKVPASGGICGRCS
jgi:hypothetical protein